MLVKLMGCHQTQTIVIYTTCLIFFNSSTKLLMRGLLENLFTASVVIRQKRGSHKKKTNYGL
ncbi:hypothetical protein HanXRQr2_Chr05g0205941 [Helianthus annuus]|uniref:Uncharacterized protein n=1 Tax=Helianthus annuus TaxID=4232 RepID=A0A9K3IYK5_HELAN|nr:hypothetical protein HanXRQr2_Chr05g0205941 [Helianthus annuus]KAJ0922035.1 hypothetical protein HanPSC8_Chr05g0198801 [Helianthus annuus]